jgi:hypothetical protein
LFGAFIACPAPGFAALAVSGTALRDQVTKEPGPAVLRGNLSGCVELIAIVLTRIGDWERRKAAHVVIVAFAIVHAPYRRFFCAVAVERALGGAGLHVTQARITLKHVIAQWRIVAARVHQVVRLRYAVVIR